MSDTAYRLQMQNGPEPGHTYELTANSLTIGRYPLADIVIDDPDVGYGLASTLYAQGDRAGAEREARRVLTLAPGHPGAAAILGDGG